MILLDIVMLVCGVGDLYSMLPFSNNAFSKHIVITQWLIEKEIILWIIFSSLFMGVVVNDR